MRSDEVRDRIASICADPPFGWTQAGTPFDFELQPITASDQVFRIEMENAEVVGGFNFSEQRADTVTIWVARNHKSDPVGTYRQLVTDASSLRAAVIRDAHVDSGQYQITDEAGMSVQREAAKAFAVLRVTVTADYETTV